IFAALSRGVSKVYGLSPAFDCVSSADCLKQVGLSFERRSPTGNGHRETALLINSPGLDGLSAPDAPLFAGNSGTSIRLLAGLLAGRPFKSELDGDDSLRRRPMGRVLKPLAQMGAKFTYVDKENYPPFVIDGSHLTGQLFELEQASAQVQTALLLAGLQADGKTTVKVPKQVRDHTARMFRYIGVPFESEGDTVVSVSRLERPVDPYTLDVPADISSAAFFMVAAACIPGSELLLTNVSINPGRDLVVQVLKEMGANIEIVDTKELCGEPVANIFVKGASLDGSTSIDGERLASGIDEIPILALAAALSKGTLTVRDADELKVKESDRLAAIVNNLQAAGADIIQSESGFKLQGKGGLKGGSKWQAFDDHRMAMTGIVAQLAAGNSIEVDNETCVAISYPDFVQDLKRLTIG
ncbi:MAG: 3-phosphoshikimate 1-carboxyvinyltransferase, partial [Candidatus Obscuribacterales bacterium]|nr:3-phosphoshikimate 1-carboxyvinyltransferase [Candidatus Obscuribacterales bacterium]